MRPDRPKSIPIVCLCPEAAWKDVAHAAGLCGPDDLTLGRLHLIDANFDRRLPHHEGEARDHIRDFLTLREVAAADEEVVWALKEKLDAVRAAQGALYTEIARLEHHNRSLDVRTSELEEEVLSAQQSAAQLQHSLNCIAASRLYRWVWRVRRLVSRDDLWVSPVNEGSA